MIEWCWKCFRDLLRCNCNDCEALNPASKEANDGLSRLSK